MAMAGRSDQTVSIHFCERSLPNILRFSPAFNYPILISQKSINCSKSHLQPCWNRSDGPTSISALQLTEKPAYKPFISSF
jgi:hypothetical protein